MSRRITDRVSQMEQKLGRAKARARLCEAIGKGERTLLRWLDEGAPSANDAVTLALACGYSEDEAWDIARECFPNPAKETA